MAGDGLITAKQRGFIFGIAARNGIAGDNLRAAVYRETGVGSIAKLTRDQAGAVIDFLISTTGALKTGAPAARPFEDQKRYNEVYGRLTKQQHGYIMWQLERLGWTSPGFRSWLEGRFGLSDLSFCDKKTAGKVIEGLKAIIRRKQETENGGQGRGQGAAEGGGGD